MSEDSIYVPSNNETSSETDETSDKSDDSENSDVSKKNNARRGIKQKVLKSLPKREVQSTSRKTEKGYKTVAYKDYVS